MVQWLGWLPSIAYPSVDPREGWWYPQTSTINWCEEDYYATPMIAEFVNTLTNLLFMYLGIKGIRNCLQQGWDRIYLISFLGYLCVGTGSFLFHASLKYPMQLVDELSMIYTTCIMVYAVFSFTQSVLFRQVLALGLISLCTFITAYYHYLQDPTFHQNAYALLTAVVVFRSMYIMEVNIRPSLQKGYIKMEHESASTSTSGTVTPPSPTDAIYQNGNGATMNGNGNGNVVHENGNGKIEGNGNGNGISNHATTNGNGYAKMATSSSQVTAETQARDLAILHRMWTIVTSGLVIFLGGFLLWNLDNEYCSLIRTWRNQLGLPWGVILEGHGWWHLMTGTGAYMSLVWGIWLRECLKGNKGGVVCRWLGDGALAGSKERERGKGRQWRWLPEVVRVERDEETGEVREMRHGGHLKVQ